MSGGGGRKPKILTPGQAKNSLMSRLGVRLKDRASQIEVKLGLRPLNVFLVWTKWNGDERGEGVECVVCRVALVPTPIVEDLSSLARTPMGAGNLTMGSLRVRSISGRYTPEFLKGHKIPEHDDVPEPYDFFYEVVADGRHGCEPERLRFRVASEPNFDAGQSEWSLLLEKQSHDMQRNGKPPTEPVATPDPIWSSRMLTAPEED